MRQEHNYMGVKYETINLGDTVCAALLNGVPVTGTTSQSRGEASMRFMLMLEAMQDMESKPMQIGDVLEYDGKVGMIDALGVERYADHLSMQEIAEGEPATVKCLHIRESLGCGEVNFRGPSSAYSEDQTPRYSLSGGPFVSRPMGRYEWSGVAEIEFWAWKSVPEANGGFKYIREVNIWREVTDVERGHRGVSPLQ